MCFLFLTVTWPFSRIRYFEQTQSRSFCDLVGHVQTPPEVTGLADSADLLQECVDGVVVAGALPRLIVGAARQLGNALEGRPRHLWTT